MIAVDTNVLVRIVADDTGQPAQVRAARVLAAGAGRIFVPTVVQAETVWVLRGGYGLAKSVIVGVLEHLEANQAFVLEEPDRCQRALALFRTGPAGYADCLILAGCEQRKLVLYTFDKRLARLPGTLPVPAIA